MMEDLGEMHINERRLFHGTSQEVIPKICKEGFDWRLYGRNGSAFGQGISTLSSPIPYFSGYKTGFSYL